MANKNWVGTDTGNVGDYGVAANWDPSGTPVAADDVIIANSSQDITAGFDQSAVALASITIDQSYTGLIGTDASTFLQIASSVVIIGQRRSGVGSFTGSKRLNLDLGTSTAAQVKVYSTATGSQDQNRAPLRIRAVNAATDLTVFGGTLAVSDDSSNSSTLGDINVNSGSVSIGDNVTLTNLTITGGTVNNDSSLTTATIKGGTLNQFDSTAATTITTVTITGGVLNHFATGTITTINLNGGTVDLTRTTEAKTVTNVTMDAKGNLITDTGTVTLTNDIALASTKKLNISVS